METTYQHHICGQASPNVGKVSPTLHNVSKLFSDLYYVKSGRLVYCEMEERETPHVWLTPSQPNARLIRKFYQLLHSIGIPCELIDSNQPNPRVLLNREHPLYIQIRERLIITSRPANGISFIHATIINPHVTANRDTQMDLSFVASTPLQILSKLREFNLLDVCKDECGHAMDVAAACGVCPRKGGVENA